MMTIQVARTNLRRAAIGCLLVLAACGGSQASSPTRGASASAGGGPATTPARAMVVRGRVLGHAGGPLVLAHATVQGPEGKPLHQTTIGADGSFVLPLEGMADRLARVQFTGVDHAVETILVATEEAPVDVTVQLGTYPAPASTDHVELVLFQPDHGMAKHPMTKQADGTFVVELTLPDGKYGYEIAGATGGPRTVNGTVAEGYEYDDGGDYKSLITVAGGKARVVFDPAKRPPAGKAAAVMFANPRGASAGLTDVVRRLEAARAASKTKMEAALEAKQSISAVFAAQSWEEPRRALAEVAKTHDQPLVRRAASVAYFALGEFSAPTDEEKAMARRILDEVTPTDTMWSLGEFSNVIEVAGETGHAAYVAAFVEKQGAKMVSDYLLNKLTRAAKEDPEKARALVAQLRDKRFARTFGAVMAAMYDPDRPTSPGKSVPSFEVKALVGDKVDPKKTYSAKSLTGKVYLLDVWATWCKPCVAELPRLHEIYAKYGNRKGKSLGILSISLDTAPEVVVKFRQDKEHPMPWLHGFAGEQGYAAVSTVLTGKPNIPVPFYVVVDEQGKVIASSPELNADALPAILDHVLR